jgi:hydrogen peroxide-dependent heme synthase
MNRPGFPTPASAPVSRTPISGGWHCSHFFYTWNRAAIASMDPVRLAAARDAAIATLDPSSSEAPLRLQTWIVSGAKADFGVMALDPDPLKVDRVHQRLMASSLGPALTPTYSFVSLTEISEYVFTPEQYAARLVSEGETEGSDAYATKVKAYSDRLGAMNKQRLTPDFPAYPNACFYPMNKKRKVGENWFLLPKEQRTAMMAEHAKSGMAFAGKVSQLITVGLGLEDWEWGVTLWAANPEFLKEIVYGMRFDEASARYAEFGPFYAGYVASPAEVLDHCLIGAA